MTGARKDNGDNVTRGCRRNIELKARCPRLELAREEADNLGAQFVAVMEQCDTYFVAPHGRLKLREFGCGRRAELIAYERPNDVAARGSDYHLAPVDDAGSLRRALAAALGVRGQVRKRRELWTWRGVRIHLDTVEGLGTFLEFEAVLTPEEADEAGHATLRELRSALGVTDEELIAGSYSDLLGL